MPKFNLNEAEFVEEIQSLWSGYGSISRYRLNNGNTRVVKHVKLPEESCHPRGWNTNLSHQRKIRSYHVECHWYEHFSNLCTDDCRVPLSYETQIHDGEFLIIMEDLNANGFPVREEHANLDDMKVCLHWLAHFHALFMESNHQDLWETGTYWHLETRPDELAALDDIPLKHAAPHIDAVLKDVSYQTLVHGDAKLANFCFSSEKQSVAAVDFQYVGKGCGMKDVAYFIGSCLYEEDCAQLEEQLLNAYFTALATAIKQHCPHIDPNAVEQAWRPLFKYAWTDFHRFVKGWSPGHWKIHGYSEDLAQQVIRELDLPNDRDRDS